MPFYTGIDLGKRKADISIIDHKGKIRAQGLVDAKIDEVLNFIKPFRKKQNIVFETCGTYYWLSDGLTKAGYENLTMAHALKLAHIIKAKVKTDRRDSLALAELLRNDYIPEGYIYPMELRESRDLARRRMNIVRKRSGEFREFKMFLTRHGFEGPNRNAIVSMKDEIMDPYRGHNIHLDQVLHDTVYFNRVYTESIKSIETQLEGILEEDKVVERLREIPGVGPWLSKYMRLEVESLDRFKNLKSFCSWCRVIPGVTQSGDSCVRGRGSKQGNAHMKYALYQSAAFAIRLNPQIKAYYTLHKERRRGTGGTMVSMNIIAHKLATAVWHCFKGRHFELDRLFSLDHLMQESA